MSYLKLKLTTDHIKEFEPHPDQGEVSGDVDKFTLGDYSYAVCHDGKLIFMGGLIEGDPCWSFWGVYSKYFRPIHVRYLKNHFKLEFDKAPCDRAHHLIPQNHVTAHLLTHVLGAEVEGVLKKYMHGQDYALYAMVK